MKKENQIKSLYCYGDEQIRKVIWSIKQNPEFCKEKEGPGIRIIKDVTGWIEREAGVDRGVTTIDTSDTVDAATYTLIVCAPSSSFWQNRKSFDHMHVFMKACAKYWGKNNDEFRYIPYAIIPRLNKSSQKGLNKEERQKQTLGAYELSNYFRYFLKVRLSRQMKVFSAKVEATAPALKIVIIDDVKTTGSTLHECANVIENYLEEVLAKRNTKNTLAIDEDNNRHEDRAIPKISINCLTIAYEA